MIPYGKHSIDQADIDAVTDVLEHGFLTQGTAVPAFESALMRYTGASYAVAVNSGTSALHIACLALGVSEGDSVWTTPNTFAASANCALYCGANVDFVDIDPVTRQISVPALKRKLAHAADTGTLPKVIVVVHFAGHMCDMKSLSLVASEFGVLLIEDAAHALGGSYQGDYKAGFPQHSVMTILSFHPVKSITSAEGGAVLTNDAELNKKLRLYASHGITKDCDDFLCPSPAVAHYEQHLLGYNYRLSDLHAALGLSQLTKLDEFISRRIERARHYQNALADLPVKLPIFDEHSAWHLYMIEVTRHDRETVFNQLREKGVGVNVHYIPVHWHPYYQQLGFKKGQFPNSEVYYRSAITLPLFPDLSADNQKYVIDVLRDCLQ